MTQIVAYLTFNGNCREAMTFYQKCLGGELTAQTVGESPVAGQMPPDMKNRVMHASLTKGSVALMASDMMGTSGVANGNAVSLLVNCSGDEEIKTFFAKLSDGGKVGHPLKEEFWGATFGDLQPLLERELDRFPHNLAGVRRAGDGVHLEALRRDHAVEDCIRAVTRPVGV
jgi:PhnB protein